MKLEATCDTCGRDFLLTQLRAEPGGTGGRCPSCGTRFARHYVSILPESIDDAEASAARLVSALAKLLGMQPGFTLDMPALLASLASEVEQGTPASRSL